MKKIIFNDEEINNIILLYKNKNSAKIIGDIYNVSSHTILRLLKKDSIEINKKNDYRKYSLDENFFNEVNPINSYFIGLMASDGNVKKNLKSFSFSQSDDFGLHLIEKICEWLKYNGVIYDSETKGNISYNVTISSEKLVNELLKHNIVPNKSSVYSYNNKALFKEFLQGYIDGDGCVGLYKKNNKEYYYISFFGNESFKNSVINLLPYESSCNKIYENYFEIKFFGENGLLFSKWLWDKPVYENSYKYQKYLDYCKNEFVFKYDIFRELNAKIVKHLEDGMSPKEISILLNINKKMIYNLKYNIKNGRNTY